MMRTLHNNNSILQADDNDPSSNAFFSVTQEYWSNTPAAQQSMTPGSIFRFCTVTGIQAEAKTLGKLNRLRCVRDLTAAEANMSYQQIISQTRNKRRK